MLIEALKKFFTSCPHFQGKDLEVDFLGKDSGSYSINPVECQPIIKKYASGGSLKQFVFTISGREDYDTADTEKNTAFYETIAEWIEKCDSKNILPELSNGKVSQKIEVLTPGHLFSDDIKSAGYMLKCRLVYTENL